MRAFLVAFMIMSGAVQAEAPKVLTDIAPVHSLVAQVMGDLGAPELLINPQDDPHHIQLRPSQARLVAGADLVIWMGEAMTPWLPRMTGNLGANATSLELLALDDLPLRVSDDDHGHEDHHGHSDPHAWLDPQNAARFVLEIAETLASADPQNAENYRANAERTEEQLAALDAEIAAQLAPVQGLTLVSYHDAYGYFFTRYGLNLAGSVADSEAAPPSAARLSEIRSLLANAPRYCVFSEPGGNDNLIASVLPDSGTTISVLDPLGIDLKPGPTLYPALLRQMATTIAECQMR